MPRPIVFFWHLALLCPAMYLNPGKHSKTRDHLRALLGFMGACTRLPPGQTHSRPEILGYTEGELSNFQLPLSRKGRRRAAACLSGQGGRRESTWI
ncbi:hypothetical protein RRG08_001461 [Elysia crispata]|uniref:Secreted protein n=1 Tax=Elysia crispata TaxID=231223 RepID=A0AAE0ZQN0_9GAST|nr:hypothetical protein RRG08_001461 [Elysia crispata]